MQIEMNLGFATVFYLLNLDPTLVADLGYYGREIRHLFENGYNFKSTLNQFVK